MELLLHFGPFKQNWNPETWIRFTHYPALQGWLNNHHKLTVTSFLMSSRIFFFVLPVMFRYLAVMALVF